MTWTHTVWGRETGEKTRIFRCQSCGKRFVLYGKGHVLGLWIAGVLLAPTIVLAIPALLLAWHRSTAERRIPVVPGAPMPRIRFRDGPPLRQCASCGGTAMPVKVTAHRHNGVPTGTDYEYACGTCKREFATEDAVGHAFAFFGSALLAGIALLFVTQASSIVWRWGPPVPLTLVIVFLLRQASERIANRLRNPPIRGETG